MLRKKKGQSTLEYIILVAGIVALLIIFLRPQGFFYRALNDTLGTASGGMENMADRLTDSRPIAP